MNKISINGFTITTDGANINISNGKVIVDGKEIKIGDAKEINIKGDVGNIQATGNVKVIGKVTGSIDAGGSIHCENVDGDVDARGSVNSGKVGGNIDAGGSVTVR